MHYATQLCHALQNAHRVTSLWSAGAEPCAAKHKPPLRSGVFRLPIDGGGALSDVLRRPTTGAERSAKQSSPTEVKNIIHCLIVVLLPGRAPPPLDKLLRLSADTQGAGPRAVRYELGADALSVLLEAADPDPPQDQRRRSPAPQTATSSAPTTRQQLKTGARRGEPRARRQRIAGRLNTRACPSAGSHELGADTSPAYSKLGPWHG